MIGIFTNHYYSMNDREHPPWNIALGTPVLVITTFGHMIKGALRKIYTTHVSSLDDGAELARKNSLTSGRMIEVGKGDTIVTFPKGVLVPEGLPVGARVWKAVPWESEEVDVVRQEGAGDG